MGDLHVRETALVPAVEQRGACVASSTEMPRGLTPRDIPGLEAGKLSPVASLRLCWEQHLPMACRVPKYHGHWSLSKPKSSGERKAQHLLMCL